VTVALWIVLALCLLASGFLSGSETAITAIPRERIMRLHGHRGERLARLATHPERTIGTILIANNFVNILAASIATILAVDLTDETIGPVLATFVLTGVVLVVGEITPKTLASRYPEEYGLAVATGLTAISTLLNPISRIFRWISNRLLLLFGISDDQDRSVTEEDVKALAALGEQAGEIDQAEREIIEALFAATDRLVREVMTPRVDIETIDLPIDEAKIRAAVSSTAHSRYPVVAPGRGLDELVGILYVKDLLRMSMDITPESAARLIREPLYVPESAALMTVLHEFRDRKVGFAMVLDEHGGVEGMITAKDLIAELIGDFQDEYDPGVPKAAPTGQGTWTADGSMTVEELSVEIDRPLPEGPYTTVGGLVMYLRGDIPAEGDIVDVDGVRLRVANMDRNRIGRVSVSVLPPGRVES
jgi:putative hemolysin